MNVVGLVGLFYPASRACVRTHAHDRVFYPTNPTNPTKSATYICSRQLFNARKAQTPWPCACRRQAGRQNTCGLPPSQRGSNSFPHHWQIRESGCFFFEVLVAFENCQLVLQVVNFAVTDMGMMASVIGSQKRQPSIMAPPF